MAKDPEVVSLNPELDPMVATDDSFTPEPEPTELELDSKPPIEPEPEPTAPPEDTPPAPEPEPDKKDGVQKRINKAVRKQREAERERDAARRELSELKVKSDTSVPAEPSPQDAPSTEAPNENDFDSIEDYHRAYADWRTAGSVKDTQRVIREELEKDRKTRADLDAQTKVDAQFDTFSKKGSKKYPDFHEVGLSPDLYDQGGVILNAVMDAENGAEIAYHLGQNRDVADEVCQKARNNPVSAVLQLGRIGAELAAKPSSIRTSTAPEPVPVVKGADGGPAPDPEKMPIDDFMKGKQKEFRKDLRLK